MTHGAAYLPDALLLRDPRSTLLAFDTAYVEGTELVGDRLCFKLSGRSERGARRTSRTVWIDAQLFLVRKVVERVERVGQAPGDTAGDRSVLVLLEPIANGTVTDAQLAEPPGRWDVDPRFKTTPWLKLATPARAVR